MPAKYLAEYIENLKGSFVILLSSRFSAKNNENILYILAYTTLHIFQHMLLLLLLPLLIIYYCDYFCPLPTETNNETNVPTRLSAHKRSKETDTHTHISSCTLAFTIKLNKTKEINKKQKEKQLYNNTLLA